MGENHRLRQNRAESLLAFRSVLVNSGVAQDLSEDLPHALLDGLFHVPLIGTRSLQLLIPGAVLLHLRPAQDLLRLLRTAQGLLQQLSFRQQPGRQNGQTHHLDESDVFLLHMVVLGMGMEQPQRMLFGGTVVAQHQIQLIVLSPAAGKGAMVLWGVSPV